TNAIVTLSLHDALPIYGHVFLAEGRVVVGRASSPPSPLFRPGIGPAFAHALRLLLVAHRMDPLRQIQRHAHGLHRRLCEIPRAALAEQIPHCAASPARRGTVARRRMAAVCLGFLSRHRAALARHFHYQFALAPVWLAAL